MARVLLAWELGGGAGHCAKLAPIAAGLVERGHEVWLAARELATAKRVFGNQPVRYFQAPYSLGPPANPVHTRTFAHVLQNTSFGDASQLEVLIAAWREIFQAIGPDLLIADHAPTALLASRWHPMRRVIVGTGFTVPPAVSPLPDLRYWMPAGPDSQELLRDEQALVDRINSLLERSELPPLLKLCDLWADTDESLLLTFAELDHHLRPPPVKYWGACTRDEGEEAAWPGNRQPRVIAYLKPPTAEWRLGETLDFLRELRVPCAAYIPGGNVAWLKRFATPSLQFLPQPMSFHLAAKYCELAILHGTAGSVTSLLLRGIPQLNIPLYLEQMVLSRRVADLGAGLQANPSRPEQISARLVVMLNSSRFRDAARLFAERHADFDPAAATKDVTDRIESLLAK